LTSALPRARRSHSFFFTDTATTEIYTLSLHDALPILRLILILNSFLGSSDSLVFSELFHSLAPRPLAARSRSEERFSRNAETDLVCRLLLEKKKGDTLNDDAPRVRGTRTAAVGVGAGD